MFFLSPTMPTSSRPLLTKEELVAQHVREAIVAGRLAPGERIRQQQLADELGISPTPVREALRALVTEGWLESRPHVGVSVAESNPSLVDEVYRLREMLEGRMAQEAAARITPGQLRRLRELNDACKEAYRVNDFSGGREANFRFHETVWEAASWPVAIGILNALWAQAPWAAMTGVRGREKRTVKEHATVIAALNKKDAEAARDAMAAHIRSGRADYLAVVGDGG
jgi:DNA-binding GntR family transcriptional regulator